MNTNILKKKKESEKDKADYFFKDIGLGAKAVDYQKVEDEGFPISVIISERKVRVKTFGAKEHTFNKWDGEKANTLWLRNLVDDVKIESTKFLKDVPKQLDNLELKSTREGFTFIDKDTENEWCILSPISSPRTLRGSRQYLKYIVWDEFNDSIKFIKDDLVPNFLSILSSTSANLKPHETNPRRCFILGNNRTFNHPLMVKLGISSIQKEVTRIYDKEGKPFMLIIFPIITEEERVEREDQNKNDWEYQLAVATGEAEHMYFNMSQYDELNYVYTYYDFSEANQWRHFEKNKEIRTTTKLIPRFTMKIGESLVNAYDIPPSEKNPLNTKYHFIDITLLSNEFKKLGYDMPIEKFIKKDKEGKPVIYASNKRHLATNVMLMDDKYIGELLRIISSDKASYENLTSKEKFYEFVLKK